MVERNLAKVEVT
ncbi:hypothetical protein VCHC55B2_0374A, partial [Vibrio cholerae HC-55B2]